MVKRIVSELQIRGYITWFVSTQAISADGLDGSIKRRNVF